MVFNIRLKVLIGFVLLLILSSIIQAFTFTITRHYILSQIRSFHSIQAQKGASEIQDFFTELNDLGYSIAVAYKENNLNIDQIVNFTLKNHRHIKKITILSPIGKELAKYDVIGNVTDDKLTYEISSESFREAITGNNAISKVYYIEKNLGPHLDLFTPIFGDDSHMLGVVKMQINLSQINEELVDIKLGEGFVYVVDSEGSLISHPSQEFVLERPNLSSRSVITSILNKKQLLQEDKQYINENNSNVVAEAVQIDGYQWIAVFERPTSDALGFLSFIRNIFIITLISSICFLLLIAFFLSENLTSSIRKLHLSIQQFEVNHAHKSIIIASGDEIEQLSRAFANLIGRLVSREKSLKEKTARLEDANEKLKTLDHLKDEFVYIASHELRTPMTAIKNYLWLVLHKESKNLSEKIKIQIMRAYISTEHLIKLVQDLLTVSRIEGKRFVLNVESINYVNVCKDVIDTLGVTALKKNIQLKLNQDDGIYKIKGDRTRISEIIQNLVGNAIKFSPEKSVIDVNIQKNGHMIETRVIDRGEGIAKADMPRLFQKFGRLAHSYKKVAEAGGTGLGLYISKQIVEAHGGKIWVESEEGKGSTFIYALPFEGTPEEKAATRRARETAKRVVTKKEK